MSGLRLRCGRSLIPALFGFFFALLVLFGPPAFAQGNGSITGAVIDNQQGRFLEGAEVSVVGTDLRTTTTRGGRFVLTGVPAGSRTVAITYPGMTEQTRTVDVTAGEVAALDEVRLDSGASPEVVMLQELSIQSTREGMAQATALQKASLQAKLVAAGDQFGDISEGNVGEYLKFLPGVGIDYTANDARAVSLRGLNPNFTTVAVDGNPMASAASSEDARRFEFEQVAINNVETIEVFKTVTSDMPADSTGGQVNLVTKSAFDRQAGSFFSYNAFITGNSENLTTSRRGAWGQGKHYLIRPNLDVNYASRLGHNVGVSMSYRLSDIYHDAPRSEYAWDFRPASGAAADNPYLRSYQLRDEQKVTHRQSFATKVDYRIADRTELMLSGQWNWYDLVFSQRGPVFDVGATPASFNGANSVTSRPTVGTITNGVLQRNKYGTTLNFTAQVKHSLDRSTISGGVYWSDANNQYRDTNKGFHSEFNPTITANQIALTNILGGDRPGIAATKTGLTGDYFRDLANYSLTPGTTNANWRSRPFTSQDTKRGINVDFRHELELAFPLELRAGLRYDETERYSQRLDIRTAPGLAAFNGAALDALVNQDYTSDVGFGFGPMETVDIYRLYQQFPNALTTVNSNLERDIEEDNTAFYLRGDARLTPSLTAVGGLRYEKREMAVTGSNATAARARRTTARLDYDEIYPSLSFKYTPQRTWVFRAGVSRTVGHPNYSDIIPDVRDPDPVTGTGGSLSIPNPHIEPYFITNFDVSAEYYVQPSGVISVSLFQKNTENFITRLPSAVPLANLPPAERDAILAEYGISPAEAAGYTVQTAENGADTRVRGIELSYSQALAFLPRPFDGLGVQFNLTKIDISGDDDGAYLAQLEDATTKSANFVLSWRYQKFNVVSTTSFVDDVFWEFNTTNGTNLLRYTDASIKTDVRLDYAFSRRLTVYLQVRNVFGEARDDYVRPQDPQFRNITLPYRHTEFGDPIFALGVKGAF